MSVNVYSLSAVGFLFGGVPATGFGEGGACKITFKNEFFTAQEGVGGEVVRSATLSELAEVTLTLLQTSLYNDYLSGLHVADRLSSKLGQGGAGVCPFALVDTNGTTFASASKMWSTKMPDLSRSNKNMDVEWVFNAAGMQVFIGGQAT